MIILRGAYFVTVCTHNRVCLFGDIVVMPNHIQGIIWIVEHEGGRGDPLGRPYVPRGPASGSIGAIMAQFKSATTKRINQLRGTPAAPVWQRNYYEVDF